MDVLPPAAMVVAPSAEVPSMAAVPFMAVFFMAAFMLLPGNDDRIATLAAAMDSWSQA